MRAQELMIGDWVCYDGDTEYESPVKVDGLTTDDISLDEQGFLGGIEGMVIPIPLTPEVLEHSGFVGDDNGNYDYHDYVWVKFLHRTSECLFVRCKTSLHEYIGEPIYVHELQHILRFCGLAELADNFKV